MAKSRAQQAAIAISMKKAGKKPKKMQKGGQTLPVDLLNSNFYKGQTLPTTNFKEAFSQKDNDLANLTAELRVMKEKLQNESKGLDRKSLKKRNAEIINLENTIKSIEQQRLSTEISGGTGLRPLGGEPFKNGGYPKSDKNDFMKRMGYYQGGGLAAPPMYGANTMPGAPETASITYQEADKARLKALEEELKEAQESTKFQDEAEAEVAKQAAAISSIEQGLSQGTELADKLGAFDKLKEKGAEKSKTLANLGEDAATNLARIGTTQADDVSKILADQLIPKGGKVIDVAKDKLSMGLGPDYMGGFGSDQAAKFGEMIQKSNPQQVILREGAEEALKQTTTNVASGLTPAQYGNIGAVASIAGEGIKMASDDQDATTMNVGESVGSGLSGVGTGIGAATTTAMLLGAPLGPVGMAAGVIGGAAYGLGKGLIQRGKARKEEAKAEKKQKAEVAKIAAKQRLEALKSKEYSGFDFGSDIRQSGGFSKKLDALQDSLTVAGVFPGLGAVPDLANTVISGGRAAYNYAKGDTAAAKSNLADAGVSLVSAVPVYGDALSVPKVASTAIKYGSKVKKGKAATRLAESLASQPNMPSVDVNQTFAAETTGVRPPIIPQMMNLPKFPQQPSIPKIGPSTRKHGGVKQAGGYKDAFMKGTRYPIVGDRYDTEKSVENLQGYIANEEEAARSLKRATNIKKQIDSGNFNLQGAPNIPNAPSYSDLLDTQKASMDTIRSNFHGQVFDLPTTKKQKGGVKLPGGMAKPIPGSDAIEFKGRSHAQGGIMVDPMTEVEGNETMDKVTMKNGGKSDYFFSQHLKMGGKSFAQRHKDILKNGGRQKDIDALAKLQEKKAGRNPNVVKLGAGGYRTYQGDQSDYSNFYTNPIDDLGNVVMTDYNMDGIDDFSQGISFRTNPFGPSGNFPVVSEDETSENNTTSTPTTTASNTKKEPTNTTKSTTQIGYPDADGDGVPDAIDPDSALFNVPIITDEFRMEGVQDADMTMGPPEFDYNSLSDEDKSVVDKAKSGAELTDLEKKALKRLNREVPGLALAAGAAQLIAPAYAFFKKDRVAEQMGAPGRIKAPTLDRVSYNTERASNAADNRAMNRFIETSGIGPAGIIAKMSAYRRKQEGDLKIAAQESRVNTQIANQEAQMAQQANIRNVANAMQVDQINTGLREAQLAANENRRLGAIDSFTERTAGLAGDLMSYKATERLARATGDMGIYERDRLRNFLKNRINPRTDKPYTNADIAEIFNKRFAQPTATEDDKKEKE